MLTAREGRKFGESGKRAANWWGSRKSGHDHHRWGGLGAKPVCNCCGESEKKAVEPILQVVEEKKRLKILQLVSGQETAEGKRLPLAGRKRSCGDRAIGRFEGDRVPSRDGRKPGTASATSSSEKTMRNTRVR